MTEEDNRTVVLELIEKRRRRIMEQLRRENPDVLEKLKASRARLERRLEKQNRRQQKGCMSGRKKWICSTLELLQEFVFVHLTSFVKTSTIKVSETSWMHGWPFLA